MVRKSISSPDRRYFSQRIEALRTAQGMHRQQLAAKLGVHGSLITKWEHYGTIPRIEVQRDIATLFGVPIETLVAPADLKTKIELDFLAVLRTLSTANRKALLQVAIGLRDTQPKIRSSAHQGVA